eukprot:scaffold34585_cov60-Phaeocystis_antarctica.AAC.1
MAKQHRNGVLYTPSKAKTDRSGAGGASRVTAPRRLLANTALSWRERDRASAQKEERRAISCALSLKSKMSRSSW